MKRFVSSFAFTILMIISLQSNAITTRIDQAETTVTVENPGLFNLERNRGYKAEIDFKNNLIASSRVRVKFYDDQNKLAGDIIFNLKGKRKANWFTGTDKITAAPSENVEGFLLYSRDLTNVDYGITPNGSILPTGSLIVGELTIQKAGIVLVRVKYRSEE